MIRTEIRIVVLCDRCETGMTCDVDEPAGTAAVFGDRLAALAAIDSATEFAGWARLDARLLCPTCTGRALCRRHGHDYRDPDPWRPNGDVDAWRVCGCGRSIPSHTDAAPDPAGGPGCGIEWRLCGRCDHIDERHLTDPPDGRPVQVQPGGHLRQDVPAGLALPTHHTSNQHESSEENAMVEPTGPPAPPTSTASAAPSVWEVAELTARLRRLTAAGPDVDPAEREAFLTDKAALLARIPTGGRR